jgi:hypothetical protein
MHPKTSHGLFIFIKGEIGVSLRHTLYTNHSTDIEVYLLGVD